MRFLSMVACALASVVVALLSAQAQMPEARFEASTTLVRVDAVVRANGHPVPDLTAADFQLSEDGKPQEITAVTLQPNRITTFLIDACSFYNVEREDGVSTAITLTNRPPLWGVAYLRTERAIARFLDTEVISRAAPQDRFAILATHEGSGRDSEPSNDPSRLRASLTGIPLPGRLEQGCRQDKNAEYSILNAIRSRRLFHNFWNIDYRDRAISHAISQAIDELSDIPGHKDLLVFGALGVDESFITELTTRANRLGISISIMDVTPFPHEPDVPHSDLSVKNWAAYRKDVAWDATQSRSATDTGGVYLRAPDPDDRKTDREIVTATAMRKGYDYFGRLRREEQEFVASALASSVYVISYKPSAASGKYHKIDLKIRRPGVTARWRAGYFDTPVEAPPIALPAPEALAQALEKPLRGTAIRLRAMPFDRADEGPKGLRPIIDLVFSMDARDLTWTQQPDGSRKARVDATAAWYERELRPEGTVTHSCDLTQKTPADAAQCVLEIDPAESGIYFVRAAVRDAMSGKLGTAWTMAPAPGYNSGHMMLSAPVVRGASGALSVDPVLTPGEVVEWKMTAYGATPDKKTKKPNMTLRISIGNEVTFKPASIGQEEPLTIEGPTSRVPLQGRLKLPTDLVPGDYILDFLVTDKLDRDKAAGGVTQNSRVAEFHIAEPNAGVRDSGTATTR